MVTGGSGLIGRALLELLSKNGHTCWVLSRRPERFRNRDNFRHLTWLSYEDLLPEVDAVVHLAGESVAALWTRRKKEKILRSRVDGARSLIQKLAQQKNPPPIFLGASAVGWYGNRRGERLTEASAPDPEKKFRWQVCEAWEKAAAEADQWGARTVFLRIGNVLDPAGGYLQALLFPWRCGFGIGLGAKEAKLSWIGLADTVRLIVFALETEELQGALNLTTPNPVSQFELMESLRDPLRPFFALRIPTWMLRLFLGEFSQAVTDSQEILPTKALRAGFCFETDRVDQLLKKVLENRGLKRGARP